MTEQDRLRRVFDKISTRLDNSLCEMKPNYDDSITGFNDAWDMSRAVPYVPQHCDEGILR
jgi:hypothetical protein